MAEDFSWRAQIKNSLTTLLFTFANKLSGFQGREPNHPTYPHLSAFPVSNVEARVRELKAELGALSRHQDAEISFLALLLRRFRARGPLTEGQSLKRN